MSAIEKELLEVTGLKSKRGESRQKYLGRLVIAVEELEDDDWETLNKPAQDWVNKGTKASNNDEEIPDFPDLEGGDEDDGDGDDGDDDGSIEEEKDPPKKASAKKGGAKKDAPKKTGAKKDPPKKADGEKREGIQVAIKKIMIPRPRISAAELTEILEERGYKVSQFTVSTIRSDFRNSLKVLVDAGLLDMEV